MSTEEVNATRLTPDMRRVGLVVIVSTIMAFLDATIVNVALKSISAGLGMTLATGQWTVTAYLLALAATATTTAWGSRRFGTRRLFLAALAVFTLASALCGIAHAPWQLLAARVLQGGASGVMGPVGQAILVTTVGPQRVARALAAFGVPIMLAPVLGPPLGGVIVTYVGWRWIFLVNVPIGAAALALGLRILPDSPDRPAGRFDRAGFVLATLAMTGLTYGLIALGSNGRLGSPGTLVPLAAGAAALAAFAVRSWGRPGALLDLSLYRSRGYSPASLAYFVLGGVIFGVTLVMPLYFQIVRHDTTAVTGLLVAPQGVGIAVAMARSAALYQRWGNRVVLAGTVVTLVATLPLAFLTAGTSDWLILPVLTARGIGIGLAGMPTMSAAYRALTPEQAGEASTQLNLLQRFGGSLGTAVLVVVLYQRLAAPGHGVPGPGAAAVASAFAVTFWAAAGMSLLAVLPAVAMVRAERRPQAAAPAVLVDSDNLV
jgi:EmrB/QacA subfamily drug resistance transporter